MSTSLSPRGWRQSSLRADEPPAATEDELLLREARERFRQITDWEGSFRQQFTQDMQFANGDSDNNWQWPQGLFANRDNEERPALTVNKTRQHCLQIINDAKQNKPEIRVHPVSDEATKEAADVYEGVIRHIEYQSNAQSAYDTATEAQVMGGIGWWRVVTDYEDDNSFNQAIFIKRVRDALTVYLDPDIREADGSDARFGFVVDDVPRDEFELKYPQFRDYLPTPVDGFGLIDGGWISENQVRVAEYYRKSERKDTLHLLEDGSKVRESDLETEDMRRLARESAVKSRDLKSDYVEWFLIVGGNIVESNEWPGKYIPLVRVIGEETIIEGRLERKGHTRALKDPQRIYNFWTSGAVESVALQSKTPYIAAAEAIENYQQIWDTANTENHPVLPYNAFTDAGQQLPPPARQEPPQMPQAYIQGLQIAQNEMMLVSGQYQPTMGQPSPQAEISGRAIALRQRQGDNATYHYIDNLAVAIRFTGRILLDLIPKVYDTPRIMRILAVDGTVDRIRLDPNAPQAMTAMQAPNMAQTGMGQAGIQPTPQQLMQQSVLRIFNPNVGRYEVVADVGPSFQTKRQEAFNAFTQIVQSAPQLMNVAGDLLFKAADFPMADELAERLQRLVPPQALGTGPSPGEQQMQQQLQGAQAHIALLSEQLAVERMKLKGKDEMRDIDAYEAVTKRMGTILSAKDTDSAYASGQEVRALIQQMVRDAIVSGGMAPVTRAAQMDMAQLAAGGQPQATPPMNGAPMNGSPGQGPPGMPPGMAPGLNTAQMRALSPVRPPDTRRSAAGQLG